jgi:hypothetical protein
MILLLEPIEEKMELLLYRFPVELSRMIRGFLVRPDWRTCCVPVSSLIKACNLWTKRVLNDDALDWYDPRIPREFPILFSQWELDVYLDWTLYGRWYLIQRTKRDDYWHLSRIHDTHWYAISFQEIHHAWRRPLLR